MNNHILLQIVREAVSHELDEGGSLLDDIIKWCKKHPDISVELTAKSHRRINIKGHGDKAGQSRIVIASGTPSDSRGTLNLRSMIKNAMRELGWTDSEIKDIPR